ncbi:PKD domain-containing protein [Agromyces larvae]|uniref:PKD domain-containing protein n=1 Tax=Agromyces larvae TaxID=2929802 RepID=A0ABY4BV74_9MICO|nr:PKD domain-containing protein [Agromyces larvae]UOE43115.1 PKD domain-containing protein [Agromyces larvae]
MVFAMVALALLGIPSAARAATSPADDTGRSWEVAVSSLASDDTAGEYALSFLSVDDGSARQVGLQDYDSVDGLAYAPDARTLYTVGFVVDELDYEHQVVTAHDATTGDVLWSTTAGDAGSRYFPMIAVSPDGAVAMTTGNDEARVDLVTRASTPFDACAGGFGFATGAAFSPDGRAWFVCRPALPAAGIELRAYDVATLSLVDTVEIPGFYPRDSRIAITPDGSTAVLSNAALATPPSVETTLRIDLVTGAHGAIEQFTAGSIALSPDSARAWVASSWYADDRALHAVDLDATAVIASLPLAVGTFANPLVTPDGSRIYMITEENTGGGWEYAVSRHNADTLAVLGDTPLPGFGVDLAVTPDQAPVARLTASEPNSPVTFDASASTVEFGTIAEYAWDFGDGASTVTTTPTVEHEYAEPGEYTATVRLTSSGGTSTEDVYTGQQMLRNGDASAVATVTVAVPEPAVPEPAVPEPAVPGSGVAGELPPAGFQGAWVVIVGFGMLVAGALAVVIVRRRVQPQRKDA